MTKGMKKDRVSDKKQVRRNRVINLLRIEGSMSRYEISKRIRYSPPVVAQIIEDLIAKGIVREIGKGKSKGGRRPILVELVPDSGFIIGVDVGQRYTTGLLIDFAGVPIAEIQEPLPASDSTEDIIARIRRILDALRAHSPFIHDRLKGIGIGLPSLIELEDQLVVFNLDPYRDLVSELNERWKIPVFIDNDARLAVLGEKWFGVGYGYSNFMSVHLGEIIGAGIVLNDNPFTGAKNHSGSIGHSKVLFPGEPCHCGSRGCLETVAAGWAIGMKGQTLVREGKGRVLMELCQGNTDRINSKLVAEAALRGDPDCKLIFKEMAEYLGRVVGSSINLLNPEMVIFGGRMAYYSNLFYEDLCASIHQNVLGALKDDYRLEISTLKEKAGPLGACALVLEEVYESSFKEVLQLV